MKNFIRHTIRWIIRGVGFCLSALLVFTFLKIFASLYHVEEESKSEICTFSTNRNTEMTEGKIYAIGQGKNQKIRADFSIISSSVQLKEHWILKSLTTYTWKNDEKHGYQFATAPLPYTELFDFQKNGIKLNCQKWTPEDSKFDVPRDINFTAAGPPETIKPDFQVETPQGRIQQLEQFAREHPDVYDQNMWNVHNALRHLYSIGNSPDLKKAMEHSNFILQHWLMDDYILHILSDWQIDKDNSAARANLLKYTQAFPNLRFLSAASFLKIGDLNAAVGDFSRARSFYLRVAEDISLDMAQYGAVAKEKLRNLEHQ